MSLPNHTVHSFETTPQLIQFVPQHGRIEPWYMNLSKTSYQATLEACLSAAAVAFANKNYIDEFNEADLVCRAAKMAEYVLGVTIDRVNFVLRVNQGDPDLEGTYQRDASGRFKYDPAPYFYKAEASSDSDAPVSEDQDVLSGFAPTFPEV